MKSDFRFTPPPGVSVCNFRALKQWLPSSPGCTLPRAVHLALRELELSSEELLAAQEGADDDLAAQPSRGLQPALQWGPAAPPALMLRALGPEAKGLGTQNVRRCPLGNKNENMCPIAMNCVGLRVQPAMQRPTLRQLEPKPAPVMRYFRAQPPCPKRYDLMSGSFHVH